MVRAGYLRGLAMFSGPDDAEMLIRASRSLVGYAEAMRVVSEPPPEVVEARREAATVRRAYLHEKQRATAAIAALRPFAAIQADILASHEYRGPADGSRSANPARLDAERRIEERLVVTDLCDMQASHREGRLGEVLRRAINFIEGRDCFRSSPEKTEEKS
ncbi:MAG: hypothetical protein QOG85_828 [Gaiellaceae bacterium]|jgi:hypothetical protein|nr:hypothetical protein [Gaiellaceae bacterium]